MHSPLHSNRIFIAHADNRAGLAVVRSLAKNGFEPVAGFVGKTFVSASRYLDSTNQYQLPHPGEFSNLFCKEVLRAARESNCIGLLPITDAAIHAFANYDQDWPLDIAMMCAPRASLNNVTAKLDHLALAQELGLPCPENITQEVIDDIEHVAERFPLPWVFKESEKSGKTSGFPVQYALDLRSAKYLLSRLPTENILIQPYHAGRINNLCVFAAAGKIVAAHQYESVRRSSGAAILRTIIEPNSKCLDYAARILSALDWEGVALVQFIVNQDGVTKYLETNGRFWASTQGSINAGWDFPYWTVKYFMEKELPVPSSGHIGSQTCYRRADFEALVSYLRGGESPVTGETPSKLKSMADFLFSFRPGIHNDVFQFDDPMPGLIDFYEYATRKLRKPESD